MNGLLARHFTCLLEKDLKFAFNGMGLPSECCEWLENRLLNDEFDKVIEFIQKRYNERKVETKFNSNVKFCRPEGDRLTVKTPTGYALVLDSVSEEDAKEELEYKFKRACNLLGKLEDEIAAGQLIYKDNISNNAIEKHPFSMQDVKDSQTKIWITDSTFKGVFAYWLYYHCPSHPRKFGPIMTELIDIVKTTFHEGTSSTPMISMAYKDVHDWIKSIVYSIPEILELNLTTNEYFAGITLDTREDPDKIVITSRYSEIPRGEDFVDIDALIQNVTYSICKEAYENI